VLDPRNAEIRYNMAISLTSQHKIDAAIAEFREAIQIEFGPDSQTFNFGLGLGDESEGLRPRWAGGSCAGATGDGAFLAAAIWP